MKYADAAGQPAVKSITNSKGKVIAATIEEVNSEEDDIVAAFTPSSVLGNCTDSGRFDKVSDITPLKCKHFIWQCLIEGPLLEFPLNTSSLVDNSCHLVLIRPNVVEKLGLEIFTPETPKTIDVTIKNHDKKKKWFSETM
jgi:hypothetical protein